jgi:1,3-beta-glucan synthase
MYIGTLNKQLFICEVNSNGDVIGGQGGCFNLVPTFEWVKRAVVSLLLVFFIAFLPLFLTGKFFFFFSYHTWALSNQGA